MASKEHNKDVPDLSPGDVVNDGRTLRTTKYTYKFIVTEFVFRFLLLVSFYE